MRKDKYYGTNTIITGEKLNKIKELGNKKSYHNQFRVVCKAKSMTEANRIANSYGLGEKCFTRDYTSETGNDIELELADKYGFIICVDGTLGENYIDIREIASIRE